MGKNTPERQDFIIDNLRVEKDLVETGLEPRALPGGLRVPWRWQIEEISQ